VKKEDRRQNTGDSRKRAVEDGGALRLRVEAEDRRQETEDRRKSQSNHENTKGGKHERKGGSDFVMSCWLLTVNGEL